MISYFPSYEFHNLFPTELSNKEVAHSGVEIEEKALGLVVKIISFPKVDGVDLGVVYRLQRYLLSVSVRMQYRIGRFWRTEFVFFGNPVAKIHNSKISKKTFFSVQITGFSTQDPLD